MDYIIPTKNDLKLILCDKGFELYMKHNWTIHVRNGRAYLTRSKVINGKSVAFHFHRELIAPVEKGFFVDHINGNTLDNRLINLRICTNQENAMNARNRKGGASLKGVYAVGSGRFGARIKHNGKSIHIGVYDTDTEAHEAYVKKAKELFGVFACSGRVCESCGNYL